jgi:hypothetical protein
MLAGERDDMNSLCKLMIVTSLLISTAACNNEETVTDTDERVILSPGGTDTIAATPEPGTMPDSMPPVAPTPEEELIRPGRHKLTLQWISWDRPGYASIAKADSGRYSIKGEQRNKNNEYLRIAGTLKPISDEYLEFKGRIETKVVQGNGGEPCIREGNMIFYAKGNRKYWRLQEMLNCDSVVTDYVDIYF